MMRLHEGETGAPEPPEDVEVSLLMAVRALAASLDVKPERAMRALSIVIRRRTAFEHLKRSSDQPRRTGHR